MTAELRKHGATEYVALEKIAPILAISVMDLLNSQYFAKSKWFQTQPGHTVSVFTVRDEGGKVLSLAVMHLVRRVGGGFIIESPTEHPLAENYYDERVLEEVRIEAGVTQ